MINVLFRNDDVNTLTPQLVGLTEIFIRRGIPVTHAIEPGNVTEETANWLKDVKKNHPGLLEIAQHGWNHTLYKKGEFDGSRSYEQQFNDLKRGKEKLESIFGDNFFPMITIPFGVYNQHTIKACDTLGYKVICRHYNYRISRRLFYRIGQIFGNPQLFGRHVSYHLNHCPGTQMFEIDSAISFIKKYYSHHTNKCEMFSAGEIIRAFQQFLKHTPVIVFLLHHRFHHQNHQIHLVEDVVDELQKRRDVWFASYSATYKEYAF